MRNLNIVHSSAAFLLHVKAENLHEIFMAKHLAIELSALALVSVYAHVAR